MARSTALLLLYFGALLHLNQGLPYGDDNNDIYSNDDYEDVATSSSNGSEMDHGEEVIVKMPYFQTSGQNMLVNEGSTIKLPCIVNRLEGFVLLWKKGEDFIAVGDRIVNPTDPRLQLIKETNGNTLVISLAEEEDAGEYVCQVSTYKPIEIKHSVQIRVKPEVHPVPDNGVIVTTVGDSVTLECEVTRGFPTPVMQWTRKERKMPTGEDSIEGLSLTYTAVTRHHSGIYICSADNGFGQASVANLKLDVQHKPEIEQEETFIHTGEGDQTEVICIIHSSPHAEVSWFKDGLPLDQTNHVINQRGNRHTLTIAQVDSSKFGQYTCKASNQYGEDEKTTEVSGKAEPALIKSDQKGSEYDRFNLEWTARSLTTVEKFKVEYKTVSAKEWKSVEAEAFPLPTEENTYTGTGMISHLKPATVYLARVSSRNAYGFSKPSQAFKFATRGADPIRSQITGNAAVPTCLASVTLALCSILALWLH